MSERNEVASTSLLDARAEAIKKIIQHSGGEKPKETDVMARLIHNAVVSACKEAAGMGFDAGYKLASNKVMNGKCE